MDWNDTLLWLVSLSAGLLAVRVFVQRPIPVGWLTTLAIIGTTVGLARWYQPESAGYYGFALWVLLMMLPTIAQRQALRLASGRHSRLARWLGRLATILHPADGWRESRLLIEALAALREGRTVEGEAILDRLRSIQSPLGRTAIALRVRQAGEWPYFLNWVHANPFGEELLVDPSLLDTYLQGLGETGERSRMLQAFSENHSDNVPPSLLLHLAAHVGDVETARLLCEGTLRGWPREMRDYWMAVARQAAGDPTAIQSMQSLASGPNRMVAVLADRKLQHPLPPMQAEELTPRASRILMDIQQEVRHDARFAVLSSTPYRRPYMTWLLAIIMTLNFLPEPTDGAYDQYQERLIERGAIVIPRRPPFPGLGLPSYDEWWRPITASFLHIGWAHFLMNLLGLLYLGGHLERAWGPWRTLFCFAASVGVSMSITPWLLEQISTHPQILAGASGGIMGLLGGILGFLMVGRLKRPTKEVVRQSTLLLIFVVLQTVFDLTHEQVSHEAHLLGLATGLFIGMVVGLLPGSLPQNANRQRMSQTDTPEPVTIS